MIYLLKYKRQKNSGSRTLLVVGVVALAVLIIVRLFGFNSISRTLVFMGAPLWGISHSVSERLASLVLLVHTKESLIENQKALQTRIDVSYQDALQLNVLRDENASLKEMFGRSPFKRALLTAVLNNPTQTPYDTLVIDAGKNLGVISGAQVSVQGSVVGSIMEVAPTWSKVKLLSSPGEEHQVIIGKTRISALATGLGAGNFDARIPRELDVVSGDPVVFPELDKRSVGVVETIVVSANDSFQRILFKSLINLAETRFVEVDLGPVH